MMAVGESWLRTDRESLPEVLEHVAGVASAYLAGVDEAPVLPRVPLPESVARPPEPVGAVAAVDRFCQTWLPSMVASSGPRFQGYVTGGATPAAVAGDWLVSALDQNVSSDEGGAAALERQVVLWMRQVLGLPAGHHGALVTGSTMANFAGLAVARQWAGRRLGVAIDEEGVSAAGPLRIYSGSPHASILKCLSMLGLGRQSLVRLPLRAGREALSPAGLEAVLEETVGPSVVVANVGTVNTGDIDDLEAIVALRERYGFWLHVDGAFGAFAALDDRVSGRVRSIGQADSVAVDLHKWMNVPYDAALVYTRHRDLQAEVFQNPGSYFAEVGDEPEFLHLVPENSRRFRALPVWLALVAYGLDGHAEIVRRCNDHADRLATLLCRLPDVSVLAPTHLNIVCFATPLAPGALVDAVARSGEAFLTTTTYDGRPAVRAAFSNWRTTDDDVDRIARAVEAAVTNRPH